MTSTFFFKSDFLSEKNPEYTITNWSGVDAYTLTINMNSIKNELKRDCTYWDGYGGFDQSKTYISYAAMSKYEMQRLERHLSELCPGAFMIKSEGIGIDGNFQKKLVD